MAQTNIPQDTLKEAMKDALTETFADHRELLRDIVVEALEDFALSEAIKEGEKTERVSRKRIFSVLTEGK